MFNLYQNLNKNNEENQNKEPDVIGHDRFYQERSRSVKRKKRVTRRAQSAAEFSKSTLSAANQRAAFRSRSKSTEQSDDDNSSCVSTSRSDSLKRLLFRGAAGSSNQRSTNVQRHDYTPLRIDNSLDRNRGDRQARDGAAAVCRNFLAENSRYELRNPLGCIGSRSDKNWFIVQDVSLSAERLLSLTPIPTCCPIAPSAETRETVLELFRDLQHPYIHPVLDIEFWETGAAVVSPLSTQGSLRDLIYGCPWDDEYCNKYSGKGEGLPLWQIQRLGRQILEALFFLRERGFPPYFHLHSGNVVLQNGVARLAGLENTLLGLQPRTPLIPDTYGFGHLLFEMTSGYELPAPPSNAHLELELERAPKVSEVLRLIFHQVRSPSLEEILYCELFRGVELRELRGAKGTHARPAPNVQCLLEQIYQQPPVQLSPVRRRFNHCQELEPWFA